MRSTIKILGIILIWFCSCKGPNNKIGLENEKEKTTDKKVAIVLDSEYNKWLEKKYGYETWNPTTKDLNIIQVVLDKAIKNNEFDFLKAPINKNIQKYYRQYIPYLNKDREKIIKINAFCEVLELPPGRGSNTNEWAKVDWKKEYVMVDDGGKCYWQITINLDKKEYKDLMVNGAS